MRKCPKSFQIPINFSPRQPCQVFSPASAMVKKEASGTRDGSGSVIDGITPDFSLGLQCFSTVGVPSICVDLSCAGRSFCFVFKKGPVGI